MMMTMFYSLALLFLSPSYGKADLKLYRDITEYYLQPIYSELLELERSCSIIVIIVNTIDSVYKKHC